MDADCLSDKAIVFGDMTEGTPYRIQALVWEALNITTTTNLNKEVRPLHQDLKPGPAECELMIMKPEPGPSLSQ